MPLSAHMLMTLPVIKDDLLSSHVMEGTTYALLQKTVFIPLSTVARDGQ